jgi:signal transduction histidine kinase
MGDEEKGHILIVDDHPGNLLTLESVLKSLDQPIVKAQSSDEALRCLLDKDFAVIILDVQMPGMDGFETAQLIRSRERSKHTPIIFMTAFGTSEPDVHRGYAAGAVDYLFKPFAPEVLRSKVAIFVNLFQMRERIKRQAEQLIAANRRLEEEIVERKRAETEIRQRSEQLQLLNAELESFSYSVSHDLRAPLRHINGFAGLLDQHATGALDDKGQRYLSSIVGAAKQMAVLIDDLLMFSRMGRTALHATTVDLGVLVQDVLLELKPDTEKRDIAWSVGRLPHVHGDLPMLRLALLNLIGNAVKYTRRCERPTIEIGSRDAETETIVFVRDNGAGFDMQYAGKLFGVFHRLHSAEEFEGTGIGLANVRRIVLRHGGRVWAEGAVGQGATFYFSLPKQAAATAETTACRADSLASPETLPL